MGIGEVSFLERERVYDVALLGKGSWSFRVVEIGLMLRKDPTWQESLTGVVSRLKLVPPCQPEERGVGEALQETECECHQNSGIWQQTGGGVGVGIQEL